MDDDEIEKLCRELDEMAQRVGARFIPDPEKIAAYKAARDRNVARDV